MTKLLVLNKPSLLLNKNSHKQTFEMMKNQSTAALNLSPKLKAESCIFVNWLPILRQLFLRKLKI